MYPDQPNGGQPNQGSPYDFIINPPTQPKKTLIPKIGGSSFAKKLILIVGGALILIIIMWIVGTIIGGSDVNEDDIVSLAQSQQEIARVAEQGEQSGDQTIKNLAKSTQLTMSSQKQEWLQFLSERGVEVDDRRLELKKNDASDQRLTAALSTNTFGAAFLEIMGIYFNDYLALLEADFTKSSDTEQQELISKHYQQTRLLVEQLPQP